MSDNDSTTIHEVDRECPRCGAKTTTLDWTGEYCPACLYCFACEGKGCRQCRDDMGE